MGLYWTLKIKIRRKKNALRSLLRRELNLRLQCNRICSCLLHIWWGINCQSFQCAFFFLIFLNCTYNLKDISLFLFKAIWANFESLSFKSIFTSFLIAFYPDFSFKAHEAIIYLISILICIGLESLPQILSPFMLQAWETQAFSSSFCSSIFSPCSYLSIESCLLWIQAG